jgi:hypothetical protein
MIDYLKFVTLTTKNFLSEGKVTICSESFKLVTTTSENDT